MFDKKRKINYFQPCQGDIESDWMYSSWFDRATIPDQICDNIAGSCCDEDGVSDAATWNSECCIREY